MASTLHDNLDIAILDQYVAAIGATTLLKSVTMFEQMAPQYLSAIVRGLDQDEKTVITSEAHKLKGAAGSIGLKRIQQLSQKLQCGDEPEWEPNHKEWFDDIRTHMDADLEMLKDYLQSQA